MKALVSTPHFILECDLVTRRVEVLESGRGEYYGISWSPDGASLALSRSGLDNSGLASLESYANSEVGFLTIGATRTWRFLSAPHQLEWVDADCILATNTGRNALARVAVADHGIVLHRYGDSLWDRLTPAGREGMHLNSVTRKGDRVFVVAHNFDKGARILELAWPSLEKVAEWPTPLVGVHNLWVMPEGRWLVCASGAGSLADARSGEEVWSGARQGYTRGLAASGGLVVVGHSEVTPQRHVRTASESGLWLVDRATWQTLDFIPLGYFGGVNEVRIHDEPDECHHGAVLRPDALAALGRGRDDERRERLQRANRPTLPAAEWAVVEATGAPEVGDGGAVRMAPGAFALALRRGVEMAAGSVRATLHLLGDSATDHASLVARYRGPGDRFMAAALFQVKGGRLMASLWVNDGEWRQLAERGFPAGEWRAWCPPAGTPALLVRLDFRADRLDLDVAGRATVSAALGAETASQLGAGAGIRLQGSSIAVSNIELAE